MAIIKLPALRSFSHFVPGYGVVNPNVDSSIPEERFARFPEEMLDNFIANGYVEPPEGYGADREEIPPNDAEGAGADDLPPAGDDPAPADPAVPAADGSGTAGDLPPAGDQAGTAKKK